MQILGEHFYNGKTQPVLHEGKKIPFTSFFQKSNFWET